MTFLPTIKATEPASSVDHDASASFGFVTDGTRDQYYIRNDIVSTVTNFFVNVTSSYLDDDNSISDYIPLSDNRIATDESRDLYPDNYTSTTPPWYIFLKDPMEVKSPHKFVPMFIPIIVTHAMTFIFGIIGNSTMIASLVRGRVSRNITSWFLTSLAASDLLLLLLCVPLETLQYFLWTPHLSLPVCKLKSYIELLSAVASVLNLTAVSLERYLVIVYPMRSRSLCTLSNCRKAIVIVWVAAMIISSPAGVTHEIFSTVYYNKTFNVTIYECEVSVESELEFAIYRLVIVFAVPALLMSFFYARVIKALWISTKAMTAMTRVYSTRFDSRYSLSSANLANIGLLPSGSAGLNNATSGSGSPHAGLALVSSFQTPRRAINRQRSGEDAKAARKQVIKMLILVIMLFMSCWGPKIILDVLRRTGSDGLFNDSIYNLQVFCGLLPFVHSCLNPVIYSYFSKHSMMSKNFGRVFRRSCVSRGTCSSLFGGLCSQGPHESQGTICHHVGSSSVEMNGGHYSLTCIPQHPIHVTEPCQHHLHLHNQKCSSVMSTPKRMDIAGSPM